ncbi:MAG: pantothenate kinase [Limnothrix sp. RL_2_0]|nr:pantothenate kinase [Limnothrix sp. RL_2_0]
MTEIWLALMIGNSRLHWAEFSGETLLKTWHSAHGILPERSSYSLYFASVVPAQTRLLLNHFPQAQEITLDNVPLKNLYPTLGIDRALAVWGAGEKYGFPCLVIDGGTALTFSAVAGDRRFMGGAILPGLSLQFRTLSQGTAKLPKVDFPETLPTRWAMNTEGAIASGILHTVLAGVEHFIQDWRQQFPTRAIILTGGDGEWLKQNLQRHNLSFFYEPELIFLALQSIKNHV